MERPPAEPGAEPAPPTPAAIAEQEQEELWREARAGAWHKRAWLRALLVIAAITGLAAIIPYPLRITSECTLIPSERVKVRSEFPGVLSEILVEEGQTVKKGDAIARIDDRALKAERAKVSADIEKIEAELATLRNGRRPEEIQQQEAVLAARVKEVEFAAKEAQRREDMAREGVGSRQAAEQASRDLEARRRAVAEAQAALRLLQAGSRPEEIAAHEAVLKRARAELAYVEERLAMTVVRAPIDGEILTPRFRERLHEGVEAGGLVCELANPRRMRAEILVPEREVDAIELGMPAVVKVESYPTLPFEGKVDFIAPTVDGEHRHLRVVVEIENEAGLLKANMTGYGEVEAGKRSLLDLATRRVLRWVRVRFLI
jgi:putative peptide zinc metalloprotease protein